MYEKIVTKLEKKERSNFKFPHWEDMYNKAVSIRAGWDDIAEKCHRVKINQLSRDSVMLEGYEDSFYQQNHLHQINTLKASSLIGGDVYIDIIPANGYRDLHVGNLESEVNYSFSFSNGDEETRNICDDFFWYGRGVGRVIVDTVGADKTWINGSPKLERVSPFRVYIDHACVEPNYRDMRWFFVVDTVDIEYLKNEFPDKQQYISENYAYIFGNSMDTDTKCSIVTCQYKKMKEIDFITITDIDTGETWEYTHREYLDNPAIVTVENIAVSKVYTKSVPCWFQFIYIANTNVVLLNPEYVGQTPNYVFINGEQHDDSPYYVSMISMLLDVQEIETLLLTAMTVMTIKNASEIPIRYRDAFENWEDVEDSQGKIGQVYDIKTSWAEAHPMLKPIEFINQTTDMMPAMNLIGLISNTINQQMGTPDSTRGTAYASQSGSALQTLQSASAVYHQKEKTKILKLIADIGERFADAIIYYNDHPHQIMSVSMSGKKEMVDVNTNIFNQIKDTGFYCVGITENNNEQQKMLRKEEAMAFFNLGLMPPEDLLREFDFSNAEAMVQRAREYSGDQEVLSIIHEIPELRDFIIGIKDKQKNIGQTGSAGYDVSGMTSKGNAGNPK